MIDQFLNKKFSTRNLSNEEFIEILPLMAVELSEFNYLPHYSDLELNDDWNKLLNWMCDKNFINSTSRIFMILKIQKDYLLKICGTILNY